MSHPVTSPDQIEQLPDPHLALTRLERERDGMPDLINCALRSGDITVVTQFRERLAQLPDLIRMARIAVANVDVDEAMERVRLAESALEPARLATVETGRAIERAREDFIQCKVDNDTTQGSYRAAQQAVMDEQRKLADAEHRVTHLLHLDANSSATQPSAADGHAKVTEITPAHWSQFPVSTRRDGSTNAG